MGAHPAVRLWALRDGVARWDAFLAALTGIAPQTLRAVGVLDLAASDLAGKMLQRAASPSGVLTTTIGLRSERCIHSVRGPIQWAETLTARANALGNDDVYVCATSGRSYDTAENRLIVRCLESIAEARRVIDSDVARMLPLASVELVRERIEVARELLGSGPFDAVTRRRPAPAEENRLRGGRRAVHLRAFLDFRRQQVAGPDVGLVAQLVDESTLRLLTYVAEVLEHLGSVGYRVERFRTVDGALISGRTIFRHPASPGVPLPGLTFAGIPILPPAKAVSGAQWAGELPERGITIASRADARRLIDQIGMPR